MYIGQIILTRLDGKLVEAFVLELLEEDIVLRYEDTKFKKKYWEIRQIKEEKK